jgi:glutamine synthetase
MPTVIAYQADLASTIQAVESVGKAKVAGQRKVLSQVTDLIEEALTLVDKLDAAIEKGDAPKTKSAMSALRKPIDALEGLVPQDLWPVPSYAEMLFMY